MNRMKLNQHKSITLFVFRWQKNVRTCTWCLIRYYFPLFDQTTSRLTFMKHCAVVDIVWRAWWHSYTAAFNENNLGCLDQWIETKKKLRRKFINFNRWQLPTTTEAIEVIIIAVEDLTQHNIKKGPNIQWNSALLPISHKLQIIPDDAGLSLMHSKCNMQNSILWNFWFIY